MLESEPCIRKRISYGGENYYMTIGDKRVMMHFCNESSYTDKDRNALLNLTCRLISKARAYGVPWDVIIKQCRDVNVGMSVITDLIADAIEDCS